MKKYIKARLKAVQRVAAPGALLLLPSLSHAAVPVAISDAMDTMQADGVTIATAFVVAVLAVFAIKFLRRAF